VVQQCLNRMSCECQHNIAAMLSHYFGFHDARRGSADLDSFLCVLCDFGHGTCLLFRQGQQTIEPWIGVVQLSSRKMRYWRGKPAVVSASWRLACVGILHTLSLQFGWPLWARCQTLASDSASICCTVRSTSGRTSSLEFPSSVWRTCSGL
jgi:hypothetical protein